MMAEIDPNLIYEVLKKLQTDMADMKEDVADLKLRTTATEEHLSTIVMSVAGINHRLDRLDAKIDRIERRLDLTDAR